MFAWIHHNFFLYQMIQEIQQESNSQDGSGAAQSSLQELLTIEIAKLPEGIVHVSGPVDLIGIFANVKKRTTGVTWLCNIYSHVNTATSHLKNSFVKIPKTGVCGMLCSLKANCSIQSVMTTS